MPDLNDKVSDIAPCPFDHEQRALGLSIVPIAELNAPRWYVRCMDCGAHGPRTGTRNSAISAWNARTRPPASSMEGETEHKRPTFEEVRARAVAAVLALDDWTNVNETEFTGWGDGDVPPIAEWWRVKSGQARKALEELFPPASPIPPEVMK